MDHCYFRNKFGLFSALSVQLPCTEKQIFSTAYTFQQILVIYQCQITPKKREDIKNLRSMRGINKNVWPKYLPLAPSLKTAQSTLKQPVIHFTKEKENILNSI